jgi:putative (di)nucleoside polyphosphate hydrolase
MTDINREDMPYRPCVGIVLINSDGLIFTAERLDTPGAWQMPQGGIDDGEDARDAALRELEEETSVSSDNIEIIAVNDGWLKYDLPDHLLGKALGGKFRGQKQKWYLAKLHGDESAIDLETEHPEFSKWKWSTVDELVSEIVPFKKELYQAIITEFETHLNQ